MIEGFWWLLILVAWVSLLVIGAAIGEWLDKRSVWFEAEKRRKANERWSEIING